ncbi:hypothetical protein AB0O47_39815 [Streptomyces noursei]|uniref:hypothetical protein n=1 Tax=Streptomyces noursei TaxID=1971 RepID=UPI003450A441
MPSDWEKVPSGGYFPHLVGLRHIPCGEESGEWLKFDLGAGQGRDYVFGHECPAEES